MTLSMYFAHVSSMGGVSGSKELVDPGPGESGGDLDWSECQREDIVNASTLRMKSCD